MANDLSIEGTNYASKAITAGLRRLLTAKFALGMLFLMACTAPPAHADGTNFATGGSTDLAINGPGYFVVRDLLSGGLNATRFGGFRFDENGFLTTQDGRRLQGFADAALTVIGDVQIDGNGSPMPSSAPPGVAGIQIQPDGRIVVVLSDGTTFVRGQILLQNFKNPSALTRVGNQLFGWTAATMPLPQPAPPSTAGTGCLLVGYLGVSQPELQISVYAGPPQTFTQGILVPTGIPTDLGVQGGGFFILRRTNDNALFATRAGAFYLDGQGYLVHYSGLRLQGYTDGSQTTIDDLQIDTEGAPIGSSPASLMQGYNIDRAGVITEYFWDGSTLVRGQVLLQGCSNPDLLARDGFDLYPIITKTGLWSPAAPAFTGNLGWIVAGAVELSQFDTNLLSVRSNLNFFCQGPLMSTGDPANLGIYGHGFFVVRDPAANVQYATRAGDFQLDALGHLVTTNGLRLQGLINGDLMQFGDLIIDTAVAPDPTLTLTSYDINNDGQIEVGLSDGSFLLRGQVFIQIYRNPQALSPAGNGLYTNLNSALPVFVKGLSAYFPPSWIMSGYVEQPSGLPAALHLPPVAGLRLFVHDISPPNWQLESSTDLTNWDVIGQVCGSNLNEEEFFDSAQTAQKFYRLVAPDPFSGKGTLLPMASRAGGVDGSIGQ